MSYVYLCAVKFYEKAMFSSKQTFRSLIPIIVTPVDNRRATMFVFAGELSHTLEKTFMVIANRDNIPLGDLEKFIKQNVEYVGTKGRVENKFAVIEQIPCVAKEISTGEHEIKLTKKAKYLTNFELTFDDSISRQQGKRCYLLKGEFKFEDYITDTFEAGKVKQRLSLIQKSMVI